MIGSKVSKRYAKALFSLGREEGRIEEYGKDLSAFADFFQSDPEFARAVSNRIFGLEERKRVLKAVLDRSGLSRSIRNFLNVLLDKNRIGVVGVITEYYGKLMDEAANIARAEVLVPKPLKSDALNRLKEKLVEMTSKQVRIEVREDPSLIGGIVVKIGDLVLDGSVKTQLRSLKESL